MTPAGKTAVVTGASSGIGEATARLLARARYNVVLAARREDRLKDLAAELGEGALAVPTDVTDPDACEHLVSRTLETFGSVDVLVANAGLGLYGSIAEGNPKDWRVMFEVNVLGVLHATRAATRHMLDRGSGDVVFVSSLAGRRVPRADGAVYAATKHALTAIAEGLRVEVQARGIRVISVEPGLVRTEFPNSSFPSAEEYYAQREYSPLEAEDVARAVLYGVEQPPHVSVNEILVRPTAQPK
ncbi:MAG: SDR family oxidoreductase [Rubrobacter sp.]|nr:SDR family oxidoreductase [Rubrobacter sp.]MBA3703373.1 SDR family oxidoreductase [Rubrobacteraceae bacterium]